MVDLSRPGKGPRVLPWEISGPSTAIGPKRARQGLFPSSSLEGPASWTPEEIKAMELQAKIKVALEKNELNHAASLLEHLDKITVSVDFFKRCKVGIYLHQELRNHPSSKISARVIRILAKWRSTYFPPSVQTMVGSPAPRAAPAIFDGAPLGRTFSLQPRGICIPQRGLGFVLTHPSDL